MANLYAVLAYVVALFLASGCATNAPEYRVGKDGTQQSKIEAERTHAALAENFAPSVAYDTPPKILSSHFPDYPLSLLKANIVGSVLVQFTIETNGSVSNPVVVGAPPPELAALSLHSIMQWKFASAMKNGLPVQVRFQQKFVFVTK